MSGSGSFRGYAVLGFLVLGGGFAAAAVAVMQPAAVVHRAGEVADAEAAAPVTMQVYVPIAEPIVVILAERPERVTLTLGVSLRASVSGLLDLRAEVEAKRPTILAALLEAAQVEVAESVEPLVLLERLPVSLRDVLNGILGSDALTAPVDEVLVVGLVVER